jgi:tripartite-type tricarboxylate transporter receptor subunit TctC
MIMMMRLIGAIFLAGTFVFPQPSWAQDFPTKTISWIIPYSPGGGGDVASRRLARIMEKDLGVPIIIKNIPGAGGIIGTTVAARSKPDGYTIGMHYAQILATSSLFHKVEYNPLNFQWIGNFVDAVYLLAVPKGSPYTSFAKLKEAKTPVRFGTTTVANNSSITAIALSQKAGFPISFVSGFGGAAPAVVATIRGEADAVLFGALLLPFIERGDLIPLVAFSEKRLAQFPAVPSVAELGYPKLQNTGRLNYFLYAPPGTPKERTEVIEQALFKAVKKEKEWLEQNFFLPDPIPGKDFGKIMQANMDLFKQYMPFIEKYK